MSRPVAVHDQPSGAPRLLDRAALQAGMAVILAFELAFRCDFDSLKILEVKG